MMVEILENKVCVSFRMPLQGTKALADKHSLFSPFCRKCHCGAKSTYGMISSSLGRSLLIQWHSSTTALLSLCQFCSLRFKSRSGGLSISQLLSLSWRLLAHQGNKNAMIQVFGLQCSCHIRIIPDDLKASRCYSSFHLVILWVLFENVMSLHRIKAAVSGLLDAGGRVNEWVVTEKLGDANKTKPSINGSDSVEVIDLKLTEADAKLTEPLVPKLLKRRSRFWER